MTFRGHAGICSMTFRGHVVILSMTFRGHAGICSSTLGWLPLLLTLAATLIRLLAFIMRC